MSRLFADTEVMRQKASELINLSAKLAELAQQINRLENAVSPSAYDGQLYGAVRAVINGAEADALQMSALVGEGAKKLAGKAQEFEVANSFAAEVMDVIFLIPRNPIVVVTKGIEVAREAIFGRPGAEESIVNNQTTQPKSQKTISKPVNASGLSSTFDDPDHAGPGIDIPGKVDENGFPASIVAPMKGTLVVSSFTNPGQLDPGQLTEEELAVIWQDPEKNFGYGNIMITEHSYDGQSDEIKKVLKEQYGLDDGQSLYAFYAHVDPASERLASVGTQLETGQEFARVGNQGLSTGPHLHLEYKVAESGKVSDYSSWADVSTTKLDPNKILGY